MIECPTASVIGFVYVPVPPALLWRIGWEISAEPGGVLSQYVYAVVYALMNTSFDVGCGTGVGIGIDTGTGMGVGVGIGTEGVGFETKLSTLPGLISWGL